MKKPIFKLIDCTYRIESQTGPLTILNNLSCLVPTNSITLISGRSGSGKTTLIHALAGLIRFNHGHCFYDDMDLTRLSKNERSKYRLNNIGIVYQSFNFLPSLTIKENIILPSILANKAYKDYTSACKKLSENLEIASILNLFPNTVSGGELQRAAMARALINSPKLILADEPSGNLDTKNRDVIFSLFKKICHEEKITIIFSSHDEQAKHVSDHIITLDDGRLVDFQ